MDTGESRDNVSICGDTLNRQNPFQAEQRRFGDVFFPRPDAIVCDADLVPDFHAKVHRRPCIEDNFRIFYFSLRISNGI